MIPPFVVRRLAADEGPALRELRLRCLRDAPFAFSQPIAEVEARRDDEWTAIAARRAVSGREGSWIAEADGAFVGLVAGYFTEPGVVHLVSMWTAPEHRRRGVGTALIDAVVEWARANGARTVGLGVSVGNEAAERLYAANGFRFTGVVESMPHDPDARQRRMERRLTARAHPRSVPVVPDPDHQVSAADLLRWAETLSGIARTGLGFTQSLYEKERFEEVLKVAADIRAGALEEAEAEALYEEWLDSVGEGVAGYVTPKVAVAAVVGNDDGEILLTQRADSGVWLYPVGWADVGYSPSEVAIKEVYEETGIEVEIESLIAVFDGLRLGFARLPLYSIVFHAQRIGGELQGHPLETRSVGFFSQGELPWPLAGGARWVDTAFAAINGEARPVDFDAPRTPPWRGEG